MQVVDVVVSPSLSKWKNCFSFFVCLLVTGAVESVAECVGFFVFQEATNS